MSLNWNWSDKCGEIEAVQTIEGTPPQKFTLELYQGNAYLIMIYNDSDKDEYQLYSFFADKQHMKNLLGLNKKDGYTTNTFNGVQTFKRIRLNKKINRYTKQIIEAFTDAFDEIAIEVFSD